MKLFFLGGIFFALFCSPYVGQHLQDKYLNEVIFKNKIGGLYVDLGANNGIYINNTFYFAKNLDWTGLCVEPHPDIFPELVENRKESICLNVGVGITSGLFTFKKIFQTDRSSDKNLPSCWSGFIDNYSDVHIKRVEEWIKNYNADYRLLDICVLNINEILEKISGKAIDLLSIDVEGNELELLKAIDWSIYDIKVILVENNDCDISFREYMHSIGYSFVARIGFDDVYIKPDIEFDFNAHELFFKENPYSLVY